MFWVFIFSCTHYGRRRHIQLSETIIAQKICEQSNQVRNVHKQSVLIFDSILTKTAQRYANVLSKGAVFSHIQNDSSKERTPLDRVIYSGGIRATTAENLAKISTLQLPVEKVKVQVVDHHKSKYRNLNQQTLIPHHTNETAATTVIHSWMNSISHRENVLHPTMTHIGCGVSLMFMHDKVPMIIAVQVFQSR